LRLQHWNVVGRGHGFHWPFLHVLAAPARTIRLCYDGYDAVLGGKQAVQRRHGEGRRAKVDDPQRPICVHLR
jgi:hypothetical protein